MVGIDLKAILFDLDGVLVNTMPIHVSAFNSCLKRFNIEVTTEAIGGQSTKDVLQGVLRGRVSERELDLLAQQKTERSLSLMRAQGERLLLKGASNILNFAAQNFLTALCTSASKNTVHFHLKESLRDYKFNLILDSSSVKKCKPDPEIYRRAPELLGLRTDECIAVEDSESGVMAASEAGVFVIHVTKERATGHRTQKNSIRVADLDEALLLIQRKFYQLT